jgi:HEAT repeats
VGLLTDSVVVRETLLPLLRHESAVVREGVIYGISHHLNDEALAMLRKIATLDSSPAVRNAAADLFDE